jgi:hypothetical protein
MKSSMQRVEAFPFEGTNDSERDTVTPRSVLYCTADRDV